MSHWIRRSIFSGRTLDETRRRAKAVGRFLGEAPWLFKARARLGPAPVPQSSERPQHVRVRPAGYLG